MNLSLRLLTFTLLFFSLTCTFFKEETSIPTEPTQDEDIESNFRWVDILDGTEIYDSPSLDSKILAKLKFRSKLKVVQAVQKEEGWEFVEYKSRQGWINMEDLSIEPPGSANGFVPEYLEDICEGIQNSLECFKAVETKVLQDGVPASREGNVLSIVVQKDKKMDFKDQPNQGENSEYFNYIDFQIEAKIHIIQYSKYEGGHLLGVHSHSGQIIKLLDYPEISPNGKKLASALFCPDSNYCENGLQIYKISKKGIQEEFSMKSSTWTGSDPVWLDEENISLFFYENGYIQEPTQKGILKHKNGKWILTKEDI
jgi:hypothetical protein